MGVARPYEPKSSRRSFGQIDHPSPYERAPIIDAHDDGFSISLVDDAHFGAKCQRPVRSGHRRWIHHFPDAVLHMRKTAGGIKITTIDTDLATGKEVVTSQINLARP